MNKSERINDMMIYLNNVSYFNIKDLTERYGISKSTALRDIQSLESIGMPIFSEHGRHGRYGILKNRLLSPITFTIEEVYAIYFSTLTLKEFQSTPFDLDLQKLKEKFESCISEKNKMNLEKMETVFSFSSSKQVNDCIFLKDILYSAINANVSEIIYRRYDKDYKYTVQFLNVSTSFGQWYTTAYNHLLKCINVFRCDKITSIRENKDIEKGIEKGIVIGLERGKLNMLYSLVQDNTIPLNVAVKHANMLEEDFEKGMKDYLDSLQCEK